MQPIRNGFTKEKFGRIVQCIPIEPLINAAKDPDFQMRQIKDFIFALRDLFSSEKEHSKKNFFYKGYPLRDYLKSVLGKAVVLDQHVNCPGFVVKNITTALDNFYQKNSPVPKDPNQWGKKREAYEKAIIDYYADIRIGTDMGRGRGRKNDKRYAKLQEYLSKK
jgi:hypothetical protein